MCTRMCTVPLTSYGYGVRVGAMKTSTVKRRVAKIRQLAHDSETAHASEDKLWVDVLRAIAAGDADNPQSLAKEALQTEAIKFDRWFA
jgi:hypothetical protein